jgi:ankyrin repeat protein
MKVYLEIVKLLISLDVDINKVNNDGTTPFYLACMNGHLEIVKSLLYYYDIDMTRESLSNHITKFNLPRDEFSNTSTNEDIKLYLITEIIWNNGKLFINFLDKTGFLYGSNEKRKESNKTNRDALSLDVHNCIHNNHRLITCFLGCKL